MALSLLQPKEQSLVRLLLPSLPRWAFQLWTMVKWRWWMEPSYTTIISRLLMLLRLLSHAGMISSVIVISIGGSWLHTLETFRITTLLLTVVARSWVLSSLVVSIKRMVLCVDTTSLDTTRWWSWTSNLILGLLSVHPLMVVREWLTTANALLILCILCCHGIALTMKRARLLAIDHHHGWIATLPITFTNCSIIGASMILMPLMATSTLTSISLIGWRSLLWIAIVGVLTLIRVTLILVHQVQRVRVVWVKARVRTHVVIRTNCWKRHVVSVIITASWCSVMSSMMVNIVIIVAMEQVWFRALLNLISPQLLRLSEVINSSGQCSLSSPTSMLTMLISTCYNSHWELTEQVTLVLMLLMVRSSLSVVAGLLRLRSGLRYLV